MAATRRQRYHSRHSVAASPSPERTPALPSSPSRSKAREIPQAVLSTGSPRKRKFQDETLKDGELKSKVISVTSLRGADNQTKISRQLEKKGEPSLKTNNIEKAHTSDLILNHGGEPRPPAEMDTCMSSPMQGAYDLGPIMSVHDSRSIDSTVPDVLDNFGWDELLRAESPDTLDIISVTNKLASDDDLDPLEVVKDTSTMRQKLEDMTTVYLAKATLDRLISDAETTLKELRSVSKMLSGQLDELDDD